MACIAGAGGAAFVHPARIEANETAITADRDRTGDCLEIREFCNQRTNISLKTLTLSPTARKKYRGHFRRDGQPAPLNAGVNGLMLGFDSPMRKVSEKVAWKTRDTDTEVAPEQEARHSPNRWPQNETG
jgi:hypothetical protein